MTDVKAEGPLQAHAVRRWLAGLSADQAWELYLDLLSLARADWRPTTPSPFLVAIRGALARTAGRERS